VFGDQPIRAGDPRHVGDGIRAGRLLVGVVPTVITVPIISPPLLFSAVKVWHHLA